MIKELDGNKFNKISKTYDNVTFYQTSNWAKLKTNTGWKSLFLAYEKDNNIKACGLFLLKKMPLFNSYLAYCPRGFLCDYENIELLNNFNKELIIYLKSKNVFELIIDPYVKLNQRDIEGNITQDSFDNKYIVDDLINIGYKHTGYNLYYENIQPRWLFRLNIKEKNIEEIINNFRKEAKRRANKKDYFAINVRELKESEINIFKDLMNKTADRKNFIDRPLSYYKQMYSSLHDDGILRYMVAEIDIKKCRENVNKEIEILKERIEKLSLHENTNSGKIKEENVTLNSKYKILDELNKLEEKGEIVPLSVVCLLTYGKEAIMLLAGNDEEYLQNFNTSNIIVTELIKLCKKEGYDYYNFYGITGNFDPKSEQYGLYTYKKQYGGEVVELIGQFEYTINSLMKKIYDIMLKAYKLTKRK